MANNDPDGGIWAVSPCISCPRCDEGGDMLDKRPYDLVVGLVEATCLNCGEHWFERDLDFDENDWE